MVETTNLRFDLSGLRVADAKWKRRGLWMGWGCGIMFALFGVGLTAGAVRHIVHPTLGLQDVWPLYGGVVVVWALVAMFGLNLTSFYPGAVALDVSASGLILTYPRGKVETWSWDEPHLRITVVDCSDEPLWTNDGISFFLERIAYPRIIGLSQRRSLLTREAFEAVVNAARVRGLQVTPGRGDALSYGCHPPLYRIHGSI